ncbi:thiaminase /4-amino-5-aminomethyl-2-methylpyrimidine deaminase [Planomicrobium soli]|uniref:Aminopyrimidine aminohydrolase n=1 Tax=Planomicrobium soli TaxID=1176648 RepID=A0A2P8GR12_9BACL|nr:thiaminase II [Planomicrobium soli]PSL36397.1 thiaminase /4-amino-5-aminomethyl-2-methylpyrimidine deaminase [Planomicrobium soli]
MPFCKEVRQECKELWQASFDHPFVKGIADGTLPLDRFRFYVMQDAYYLSHFAKVQAIGAVKAKDLETTKRFAHHAEQTCAAEMALHESFMELLDVTKEDWAAFEPSPSAYAYVSHMYRSAEGDLADVLAAILPCYWLYYEIGENLKNAKPDHPIYKRWIETYGSEWFGKLVIEQIERMDELAEGLPEIRRSELKDRFRRSSYYEWNFWEQAWKKETWSVEALDKAGV